MRFSTFLLICLTYSHIAQAETIHRCADQSGKVSYSTTPCAAGTTQVKTLDPAPPPEATPSDQSQSYKDEERAFQERHAERMEREAALKKHDEESARLREEADERAENERLEEEWYGPTHRYERRVREKKYIDPAP